jgi:hypothetical protein
LLDDNDDGKLTKKKTRVGISSLEDLILHNSRVSTVSGQQPEIFM